MCWNFGGFLAMSCRVIPLLLGRKHRRIAWVICFLLILYILYQLLSNQEVQVEESDNDPSLREWTVERPCNALHIREKLCQEYLDDKIGGNICEDLCLKDTISLEPICSAKKETTIVIFGRLKDKEIVLKAKKNSHRYNELDEELGFALQNQGHDQNRLQAFINIIHNHVIQEIYIENLRSKISPSEMFQHMYHPYSLKNISPVEMKSLWALLQQEEYIKLQLLKGSKHFPRIYGFCGHYYAIERVTSLNDLVGITKLPLPWSKRVEIALELLELTTEFKSTSIGSLAHCDIQPGNFGLAKDGRVVALDIDTVFTESQMDTFMADGTNCSSHSQCTFFDCMSICENGKCSNKILSNNLHIICRDLFDSGWTLPGLLGPLSGKTFLVNQLKMYLRQCADKTKLPWSVHHVDVLKKKIYSLLLKSTKT